MNNHWGQNIAKRQSDPIPDQDKIDNDSQPKCAKTRTQGQNTELSF